MGVINQLISGGHHPVSTRQPFPVNQLIGVSGIRGSLAYEIDGEITGML